MSEISIRKLEAGDMRATLHLMSETLQVADEQLRLLENLLDMLEYGLVVVDAAAGVRYVNRSGQMLLAASASPLRLLDGRVQARDKNAAGQLAQALRGVCADRRMSAFFASYPSGSPLRVVLAPLPVGGQAGAALWIAHADAKLADHRTLANFFGLSEAEARLGAALLAGSTPRECARQAGVGLTTVRTHLHNMFAKTGARRQAELVALLATVPPLEFPPLENLQ